MNVDQIQNTIVGIRVVIWFYFFPINHFCISKIWNQLPQKDKFATKVVKWDFKIMNFKSPIDTGILHRH